MTLPRGRRAGLFALALAACAPATTGSNPADEPTPAPLPAGQEADPLPDFPLDPETAYALQRMPLYTTGVPAFRRAYPEADGRGVLVAILDSGIDCSIPGLMATTTGQPKILDLRDFSREGVIPLAPVAPGADLIAWRGLSLAGFSRVRALNAAGPWFAGVFAERQLGKTPAADVDGNGRVGDSLLVVVTRASDGWVLLADLDRNGTLADEKPVRDYLVSREPFGWSAGGTGPRVGLAANLSENGGVPSLALYFDTSGHGSHVAGIAAGNDMYGVAGFHGVAPGAQLLGLKIANNAHGGITTTGSMVRAMDYAIGFAARRRMPLVINISFAVGNEIEGRARIDEVIDSVMDRHPEVVVVLSAGNDGPGLSTVGLPASAARAITVGAVLPGDPTLPAETRQEPIAYYSARGGEVAKPELVAPGTAYSTVPAWDRAEVTKSGTSMAAPHVAGLAAVLLGLLEQSKQPRPAARMVRQALMVTARPVAGASWSDQGAGIPDLGAAWRWISAAPAAAQVDVTGPSGWTGALLPADPSAPLTPWQFTLRRPPGLPPVRYILRPSDNWLLAPESVLMDDTVATVSIEFRGDLLGKLGTVTGVVSGWTEDTLAGPAFRLVTTVGQSVSGLDGFRESAARPIPAGEERRLFIVADSGRPFEARARIGGRQPLLVFLHEPNGMPWRGGEPQIAGLGAEEAHFRVDGRDVVPGRYELVAVAPPTEASSARFEVRSPAVEFDARRVKSGVETIVRHGPATGTQVRLGLVGAERTVPLAARGGDTVQTTFMLPPWATRLVADLSMNREQWNRFTDFGLTLLDSTGTPVETAPLNYAFGRLDVELDPADGERKVSLALFPALADPESREVWQARLSIRLYADQEVTLAPANEARDNGTAIYPLPAIPWKLGAEFVPLGLMEVIEKDAVWTREVPLPDPEGVLLP